MLGHVHEMLHRPSSRLGRFAAHVGVGLVFFGSLALGFGYIVMRLWNAVLPDVLSVKPLTYWQAVGLLLLCRLLVGGCHGRRHPHDFDRYAARRDAALNGFVEHGRSEKC